MPFPSQQVESLVRALAASLTPLTLAAVIVDLRANDQITDAAQDLADYAERTEVDNTDGSRTRSARTR